MSARIRSLAGMSAIVGAVGALGAVTPAAAAEPELTSGLGCAAPCIDQALLDPGAYSVGLRVRTGVPARIVASVARRENPGDGGLVQQVYLDSKSSLFRTQRWFTRLKNLEPDKLYEFTIKATDEQGRSYRRQTTFRTDDLETIGDDGPGSFDSGAGCSAQCIRTAQASVGGRDAEVTVHTNVPARINISADRRPPSQTSLGPMFAGQPEARIDSGDMRTSFTGMLDGLQPDSRYNVIVRAIDANGRVSTREGTLDTDARHAKVVFDRIKVTADADKGRNRGEIRFRVALNSDAQRQLYRGEDKIKSGKTVHLPNGGEATFDDVSRGMLIQVQGIERDYKGCWGWHFDARGDGLLDPLQGSDKWDCNRWTWSIAQGFFDLDAPPALDPGLPGAYGGGGTINFSLPVERSSLRFQVDGHVDVWYG